MWIARVFLLQSASTFTIFLTGNILYVLCRWFFFLSKVQKLKIQTLFIGSGFEIQDHLSVRVESNALVNLCQWL